jgi:excisionase family DNA binding protein
MTDKLAYRIPEAAQALSVGQTKIREWIAEGRIAAVKDGQITLVTRNSLEAFLATLPPLHAQPKNTAQS